ncbi:threonyl-tRNA synthetase [Leptospirillum sp. Group II 'CF-1']|jgi:threonyl-tRNA synthetase|uniref:threonine--tRNA ligase n=1 Tax=Leptospirillum sp. Group II 'CF-1' TaxID=1660083 RepID=UPI000314D28E|nr:threonine--tRNA ligase [Leptospirillum sp. Group II 'CF-1']AKS22558.1 threonyl-tRNA synthetase [Leptospirillum sp. Group II 'CF-1']
MVTSARSGEIPLTEGQMGPKSMTEKESESLRALRHSAAHTLAQAVKKLYPSAQVGVGPATEEGFYYDFRYERPFTPEDLERIENEMKSLIRSSLPIVRKPVSRGEAEKLFRERNEPFKLELIQGIPEDAEITVYEQGEFVDLCRGPHVSSTGEIPAVRLLSTSSAYWKGVESNPSLQRIYGTAFHSEKELEEYLRQQEEIQRRDHRKLGRELGLFRTLDEKGAGLVLWLPRGSQIRRTLEELWKILHDRHGYRYVYTPHIARLDLWMQSGHWDYYQDSMFRPMETEGTAYELKPMNCPFHILIFRESVQSYRDLPIRLSELGTVYRYERSGTLHGLMRVRGFTQDDAHIFCKPEDLAGEIRNVLALVDQMIGRFGFTDRTVYLSTRPEKSVGSDENWEMATGSLRRALEESGIPYEVDPGEGVFYGPKIDIKFHDAIGRAWQLSTIQVDFNLPEKFDLTYRNDSGEPCRPIMIHRALFGSIERFFGILIEHYAGAFPLWLAPEQVRIMTIADRHIPYAQTVLNRLKDRGVRAEGDFRNEKIGFKVREAQMAKIPEMWVVGDREVEENRVSVRTREGEKKDLRPLESELEDLFRRSGPPEMLPRSNGF